jgi:hypothetical protein
MKPEQPAEGILKTNDWGDAKTYHVVCDCGSADHTHDLWVESDGHDITVTIYATVKSPWWTWNRWQQIWKLMTQGYLQHETVLSINQQTALNYAKTLESAIIDVETFRKKRQENA